MIGVSTGRGFVLHASGGPSGPSSWKKRSSRHNSRTQSEDVVNIRYFLCWTLRLVLVLVLILLPYTMKFHLLASTILVHKAPFRLESKCIVWPLCISVGMLGNTGVQKCKVSKAWASETVDWCFVHLYLPFGREISSRRRKSTTRLLKHSST